ncbi:uncharacterized protein LOC103784597 [Pan paniscus]|uniref:uncharacterized protein LOC103784597 n=1 Tax=Pan paniscus TaxID=9597 RepID=UPI0024373FA0|nr:uncharacterized protein LOC103784597 [Pan paniscus]
MRHGPAKSPTPRSPPGRPSPGRAAAALSARPGRASRRPLSAAPASLGHLKETGPPAALLLAPCSPPLLPSSPPPPLGSTAASSRQEASLTPPALLSARTPPSRPRPLPRPSQRHAPSAPPGFAPPSCHASTAGSRPPAGPQATPPGAPTPAAQRDFPSSFSAPGSPVPQVPTDLPVRPILRAPSVAVLRSTVLRLKPCDVLATTLRICRVLKFLRTPHSCPVRKRPWPGSSDARPRLGALSSLARRRGELAREPLVVCRQRCYVVALILHAWSRL